MKACNNELNISTYFIRSDHSKNDHPLERSQIAMPITRQFHVLRFLWK